jgi:uncharacterized damage-inducible protein DinB
MTDRLSVMARYNAWANHTLFRAVGDLSDDAFRADRGVFFRSLRGTLNHVLVADRLWMGRFTGRPEPGLRLDAILFDGFEALHAARQAEDTRIMSYVDGLDAATLAETFTYTRATAPGTYVAELGPALDHVFNHQTHHRGQAHAVLTGLGAAAPALDLMAFYAEVGYGGLIRLT